MTRPASSSDPDRAPRHPIFSRFIIAGVVLGVILATGGALLAEQANQPDHATYSLGRTVMYFAVLGGGLGAFLGACAALAADRRR